MCKQKKKKKKKKKKKNEARYVDTLCIVVLCCGLGLGWLGQEIGLHCRCTPQIYLSRLIL